MELWIRSQDKETLVKTNLVAFKKFDDCYGIINYININDWFGLGSYKTKERALEVLDEIQKLLMPITEVKQEVENLTISFKNIDNLVYEMPKE